MNANMKTILNISEHMKTRIILALLGLLASREVTFGIRSEQIGPDASAVAPKGLVEIVRHPSRVYLYDWSGALFYYFQASPAQINEFVERFAKAPMRDHVIRIEPAGTNTVKSSNGTTSSIRIDAEQQEMGTNTVTSFNGTTIAYNVRLQIVPGYSRAAESLETVAELTIYVVKDRSLLQQLKLPDQAIVECAIKGMNLKGKQTRPKRQVWCGAVQFDDGKPANDWEHGVYTRITLWEQDSPDGITLAQVTSKGLFNAAFSDDELAALRQGRSWLTIMVGNQGAVAKKDDLRFPSGKLVRDPERATPQLVACPNYYYGRILFEDGTPPVLDRKQWPRASEITVEFPFSVYARPDGEGYFKVSFSPEQLAQAKAQKPEKNIWVPVNDQGNGGAVETFPVNILSTDKAKAGVVRIPKPRFLNDLRARYEPKLAPSLIGKPLPGLKELGVDLLPRGTDGKMILICLFDMNQRPSRNCLLQLNTKAQEHKAKGVLVAAIQASKVDERSLDEWIKKNNIQFPIGMIQADEEKTRFEWGVKALPWLILTDRKHKVIAEGFGLAELDEKIKSVGQKQE